MGFRHPITTADALDTGTYTSAGVRIYEDTSAGYPRGVVEFYNGVTASGSLTSSPYLVDQGGGVFTTVGSSTVLKGINDHGHTAPSLQLNVEEDAVNGGFRSVARIADAEVLEFGAKAKLRQLVGSGSYPAGYGTISFGVADIDSHHGFTIPAGSTFSTRWTCPTGQGGLYAVEGRAAINSITAGNSATCRLLRNGLAIDGTVGDILRPRDTDSAIPNTGRQLIQLVAGDYLEFQGFALGQTWNTRVTTTDGVASTLTIERVG
jgi:hypothetical protein